MEIIPTIKCPKCFRETEITEALTAQSNQNVIFQCPKCHYEKRNIETCKG